MSYENDNLINLNLSAEELNKKIDNNTYQLRFVLEKFSQQLNEISYKLFLFLTFL